MYDNGAYCGKTVIITRDSTGASIQALVADECPTCRDAQSLDLSLGAFEALGTLDEGVCESSGLASDHRASRLTCAFLPSRDDLALHQLIVTDRIIRWK